MTTIPARTLIVGSGARELATFFVGQGVGLMNGVQSTRQVVYDFMEDFLAATERLGGVMAP